MVKKMNNEWNYIDIIYNYIYIADSAAFKKKKKIESFDTGPLARL